MKIKKEKQKNSRLKITVEIEPRELVKFYRVAYEKIAKTVKVDGFRAGKAPYKVVEAATGYNRLVSEGVNTALTESYPEVLQKEKIVPISQPKIEVKKTPTFSLDLEEIHDDFVYTATLDVMPQVVLGDIKSLKGKKPQKRQIKEEDIKKILDHLRKQKATFEEINRPVKKGDRIEINFEGFLKKVPIDKMSSKNHPLILGEGNLIPGFEDKLLEMKKGEEKEFKIKFPKDYHDKEIASKEAEFKVKLLEAKKVIKPKLDDDFAKSFGQKSLNSLKKSIQENLAKELEMEYKQKLEVLAVEKALTKLKVEVPKGLVDQEINKMIDGFKKQVESKGINFDQYLKSLKKTDDSIREEMRTQAEKNVKIGLMLGKIIEENKYDPKDKEAGKKAIEYLIKTIIK